MLLVHAGSVFAADPEGHGSPSLFAGDLGNVVWTLVTFLAVVVVLGRFAWKPLLAALQKREQFIHESLAKARTDREEAEARLRDIESRLGAARQEATALVEEGRRDADVVRRQAQEQTKREADDMLERARREIALAKNTAVKELYDLTGKLATDAASKIIRRELSPAEHDRLVREAIDEMARDRNGKG